MKNYGKIVALGQLEESDAPQLITGRILPVVNYLTAPITGKPCVYYEVRTDQLAERTDENGLAGEIEDGKVWEFRCGEIVASDFVLFDPAFPSIELYIPGTQVSIKVHATEEIRAGRSKVIKQSKLPDHTRVNTHLSVAQITVLDAAACLTNSMSCPGLLEKAQLPTPGVQRQARQECPVSRSQL